MQQVEQITPGRVGEGLEYLIHTLSYAGNYLHVKRSKTVVRVFDDDVVLDVVERLRVDAAKCADASAWSLSDTDLVAALDGVHRLEQTIAAVKLHLVREIDGRDIASVHHFAGTAAWLRSRLLVDPAAARTLVELATAVDQHPGVDASLCAGAIHIRQVGAITDALDALPTASVGADVIADAETALVEMAAEFEPAKLRRLGARILDHVAPDIAERAEQAALEREEERARQKRGFTLSPPVAGRVRVSGYLTVEDAAIVNAALDPLCTPIAGDGRTPPQLRADALVDVCRLALRTTHLPDNGGEPPQLAVTVAYDPLTQQLGTGLLDNGDRLSATATRRLACDAQILPMVLGGTGQILDAGRARRLATGPLRRALVARDRGCAFPGCDRPPRWCDAHHVVPWSAGGQTGLPNLVLLCGHHHRLIHRSDWTVRLAADGLPEFISPPIVDVTQRPRRNLYHRRT